MEKTTFISETYDKFDNLSSFDTTIGIIFDTNLNTQTVTFNLHAGKKEGILTIIIKVEISSDYIRYDTYYGGSIIFNIDGIKNIELKSRTKSPQMDEDEDDNTYTETIWYVISIDSLIEIAEANSLSVRIKGEDFRCDIMDANDFADYCKLFYNQALDETRYSEEAQTYYSKLTSSTEEHNINLGSTINTLKNAEGCLSELSGCLGVFVIPVLGLGIIFGVVKLIQVLIA